jgi:D-tyrosyl-tRNA(Tyr) deacylase
VDGKPEARIGRGILVFVGIRSSDGPAAADYLADKLVNLRIFPDEAGPGSSGPGSSGKMNRSALETGAELLVVSQFTLYGDCRKGRRPAFDAAASPAVARELYEYVIEKIREKGLTTRSGIFQAHMEVELVNDGPVTLMLES